MNKSVRKIVVSALALATAFTLAQGMAPVKAQSKTTITWFVGLGTGTDATNQIPTEKQVVADFNASHPDIDLQINIASTNQEAQATMDTLIASGHAPDIVGPVGVQGSEFYAGQWLDLTSLIAKNKYNTAQFPDAVMKILHRRQQPVRSSVRRLSRRDLLQQGSVRRSRTEVPARQVWRQVQSGWQGCRLGLQHRCQIAKLLTVDPMVRTRRRRFDPTKIVQFGYDNTFDTMRADMETFGGGAVVGADGKVNINPAWRAEVHWQWDAMWKDHFMPNTTYGNSDLLKPNTFGSGKLAMTRAPLWFNCCAESADKPDQVRSGPRAVLQRHGLCARRC